MSSVAGSGSSAANMTSPNILLVFASVVIGVASQTILYQPYHPGGGLSAGTRAVFREAPWHAGLYTTTTSPYKQICGATVVTKYAVVTAAHCFAKDRRAVNPSEFAVAAGKIYRPWNDPQDKGFQKTGIAEIHIPKRYQGSVANFQDDIAIVIISEWFFFNDFVQPACVSFNPDYDLEQLQEGKLGKLVGWGQTGPNTPASQVLQVTSLPSISIDKCIDQSPVSFRSAITSDKFCAGYSNGTAVCHGDSGGGLVFPGLVNGVSRMFLRGVASTSPPDENSCNIHTWATFTHLLRHEHFIKAAVPDVEDACDDPSSLGLRYSGGGGQVRCRCSCVCK